MKKYFIHIMLPLFSLCLLLNSCQAIADIFKAGVWIGVLMVVGIIALIIFLLTRFTKK